MIWCYVNKKNCYFIYGTGKTFFGSHLIVKAIYNSGTYENWIVCDMKPKRIICRLVPEKDDKENEYPEV